MSEPIYYSVGRVARIIACSSSTVQRLVDRGLLAGRRRGRFREVSRDSLERFMEQYGIPLQWLPKGN